MIRPFRRMFGSVIISALARKMRRNGVPPAVIHEFLTDDTLQNAAIDEAEQRYSGPNEKGEFLKWLSEHADEIIKVIMMLITLFAANPPTPQQLGDQLLTDFHPVSGPDVFNG